MKITEFESCGAACGIYLIRNLINQHVYVGQTARKFINRWQEYVAISKNLKAKRNVNSLILAIRKYGIENFDFSILELCEKSQLDTREKFWIKAFDADSHNNYNQTSGGQNANLESVKPNWFDALIKDLAQTNISINDLAKKYNITTSIIYNINIGARHYQKNITYPIRKADKTKRLELIANDIINSNLVFEDIAKKYNCSVSMIKRINQGKPGYQIDKANYPLRKLKVLDLDIIVNLLATTTLSFKEIAKKVGATESSIYKINQGTRNFNNKLSYPIRK